MFCTSTQRLHIHRAKGPMCRSLTSIKDGPHAPASFHCANWRPGFPGYGRRSLAPVGWQFKQTAPATAGKPPRSRGSPKSEDPRSKPPAGLLCRARSGRHEGSRGQTTDSWRARNAIQSAFSTFRDEHPPAPPSLPDF